MRRSADNTLCQHLSAPTPGFQHPPRVGSQVGASDRRWAPPTAAKREFRWISPYGTRASS
eukprot:scaffold47785_cov36-Phaeocystis_antarctica.AAC.1